MTITTSLWALCSQFGMASAIPCRLLLKDYNVDTKDVGNPVTFQALGYLMLLSRLWKTCLTAVCKIVICMVTRWLVTGHCQYSLDHRRWNACCCCLASCWTVHWPVLVMEWLCLMEGGNAGLCTGVSHSAMSTKTTALMKWSPQLTAFIGHSLHVVGR